MLDQYFTKPWALRRHRRRLLGRYLDSFAAESGKLGYSCQTVQHQCHVIGHFSDWLERRHILVGDINAEIIEHHVRQHGRRRAARGGAAAALRRFLDHLRARGVAPQPTRLPRGSACEALLDSFEKHLTVQRRVLPATAANYASFAREFLSGCHPDGIPRVRDLCASDVSKFVVTWTRKHPPGRARLLGTALRSFFRFLLQHGEIDVDLALAVPSVAGWRLAGLPKYLPAEQVERVLASCDRSTAGGRRDYAILVLLARLGVRAREVACLELGDLDWGTGEFVVRGKGSREDRLPLLPEVGEALADYLRHDRPVCATRRVFVRMRAPFRGIAEHGTVTAIVCAALRRAGLNPPFRGAHTLRHSLATRMLAGGASMGEIAEVLRHRSPQTTEIYAKVDFGALRSLALRWPGKEGGR
jgi:site-specific recombinase XerD